MRRTALVLLLVLALACASPDGGPPAAPAPQRPLPEALLGSARAARAEGDLDRARTELEEAVAAAPGWDLPRLELAEVLVLEGRDLERANALVEAPVRSDNPRAHLLRAQLAELRGDDVAAAAAYAQALLLRPDPEVRLRRALLLERMGREADAAAELERIRIERPGDVAARDHLAAIYEREGRLAEAEAELVAAAQVPPSRASTWQRLAAFYARNGDAVRARSAEARARDLDGRAERALRPLPPSRN
jgi:predicted Zn-dependent protease